MKAEIDAAGGEASVFAAASVDAWSDDALVEEFRRQQQDAYTSLAKDLEQVIRRLDAPSRRRATRAPAAGRRLQIFRERFAAIERVDFFGSAGRDRLVTLLARLDERISKRRQAPAMSDRPGDRDRAAYRNRLWVTRPRPGVDRMSSAWLIRRFIDPEARFGFVRERDAAPREALPFDMFGVELTHKGDDCTFETLCAVFGLSDPALARIAALVHDLDLKDGKFGVSEASSVGMIIDGLQFAYSDDDALLTQGMVLFEALYRAADREVRRPGPRVVSAKRQHRDVRQRTRSR